MHVSGLLQNARQQQVTARDNVIRFSNAVGNILVREAVLRNRGQLSD
jgi:hypothetical protein